jgi:hypothetical protein
VPWTVEDVDKHRKGLRPADKETWVAIANKAHVSGRSWNYPVAESRADPSTTRGRRGYLKPQRDALSTTAPSEEPGAVQKRDGEGLSALLATA